MCQIDLKLPPQVYILNKNKFCMENTTNERNTTIK